MSHPVSASRGAHAALAALAAALLAVPAAAVVAPLAAQPVATTVTSTRQFAAAGLTFDFPYDLMLGVVRADHAWSASGTYRSVAETFLGLDGADMKATTSGSIALRAAAVLYQPRYDAAGGYRSELRVQSAGGAAAPGGVLEVRSVADRPTTGLATSLLAQGEAAPILSGTMRFDVTAYRAGLGLERHDITPLDLGSGRSGGQQFPTVIPVRTAAQTTGRSAATTSATDLGTVLYDPIGSSYTRPSDAPCRLGCVAEKLNTKIEYNTLSSFATASVFLEQEYKLTFDRPSTGLLFGRDVRVRRGPGGAWSAPTDRLTFDGWDASDAEVEIPDGSQAPLLAQPFYGLAGTLTSRAWITVDQFLLLTGGQVQTGGHSLGPILNEVFDPAPQTLVLFERTDAVTFAPQVGEVFTLVAAPPIVTPEPGSLALLAGGLVAVAGVAGARRRG